MSTFFAISKFILLMLVIAIAAGGGK